MHTDRSRITRRKLLDAARDEFAEHGIAGARVDRIASASAVNKQRIYANFNSKEGLFSAVISDAYVDLNSSVPLPETLEEARGYAQRVFDFHVNDPRLARLIAWEGLHYGGGNFPDHEKRAAYYADKCTKLASVLGIPAPDDAAHLVLILIGIATWPFVAQQQRTLLVRPGQEGVGALRANLGFYGAAAIDAAIRKNR